MSPGACACADDQRAGRGVNGVPGMSALDLPPLELLYEAPGLPAFDLPEALGVVHRGSIGFTAPRLFANVTTSLGGVFNITDSFKGGDSADAGEHARFLAGLLRACADAVLVSGDVGVDHLETHLSAEDAYPPAAPAYAQLRRLRGRAPRPRPVVVVSRDTPGRHVEFVADTLVLASGRCAWSLRKQYPASTALIEVVESSLGPPAIVHALTKRGYELILCEGCPAFVGGLLAAGVVDELFLAHAPLLAGRSDRKRARIIGQTPPHVLDQPVSARLLSLRRSGSHVFSRYEFDARQESDPQAGSS